MISQRTLAIGGIVLALVLAAAVAPFASTEPDGLERVALDQGLAAAAPPEAAPGRLSTATAGVLGTLVVLALGLGLARLLARKPA